ncbi:MAG: hypothetical protein FWF78_04060 [Defluviitaleaceae bacterium]|nr:hypothetical protein [Defluviitaleaceae bacterium]
MRRLYCPTCGTPDPTTKRMSGFEKKSRMQHIKEMLLWCIPVLGDLIFVGTTITDLKKYNVAICSNCNKKWEVNI